MLLTDQQVIGFLSSFFWPFTRLMGVFLVAPIFGSSLLPVQFRVLLAVVLAGCLAAWGGPWAALPPTMIGLMLSAAISISFGFMLGLVGQIIVAAVTGAGEVAGFALGINFATLVGIASPGETPVLSQVFQWAGWMVYLGLGGPFFTMEAVAKSFHSVPAGIPDIGAIGSLFAFGGAIFQDATLLALPALAAGLAINVVVAVANALASQLNVFSIGFPLLFLGGVWVIASTIFYIEPVAIDLIRQGGTLLTMLTHG